MKVDGVITARVLDAEADADEAFVVVVTGIEDR